MTQVRFQSRAVYPWKMMLLAAARLGSLVIGVAILGMGVSIIYLSLEEIALKLLILKNTNGALYFFSALALLELAAYEATGIMVLSELIEAAKAIYAHFNRRYSIANQKISDGKTTLNLNHVSCLSLEQRRVARACNAGDVIFKSGASAQRWISVDQFNELVTLLSIRQPMLDVFYPVKFKMFSAIIAGLVVLGWLTIHKSLVNLAILIWGAAGLLILKMFDAVLAKSFYITKDYLVERIATSSIATNILFRHSIKDVKVHQSILGKWLDYATIEWHSKDGGRYVWRDVDSFSEVKKALQI